MFQFIRTYTRPNVNVPYVHESNDANYVSANNQIIPLITNAQNSGAFLSKTTEVDPNGLWVKLISNWSSQIDFNNFINANMAAFTARENTINTYNTANGITETTETAVV